MGGRTYQLEHRAQRPEIDETSQEGDGTRVAYAAKPPARPTPRWRRRRTDGVQGHRADVRDGADLPARLSRGRDSRSAWAADEDRAAQPRYRADAEDQGADRARGCRPRIPCKYCIHFHTIAARNNGASDTRSRRRFAMAALSREWSTVAPTARPSTRRPFRKEVDMIVKEAKKQSKQRGALAPRRGAAREVQSSRGSHAAPLAAPCSAENVLLSPPRPHDIAARMPRELAAAGAPRVSSLVELAAARRRDLSASNHHLPARVGGLGRNPDEDVRVATRPPRAWPPRHGTKLWSARSA